MGLTEILCIGTDSLLAVGKRPSAPRPHCRTPAKKLTAKGLLAPAPKKSVSTLSHVATHPKTLSSRSSLQNLSRIQDSLVEPRYDSVTIQVRTDNKNFIVLKTTSREEIFVISVHDVSEQKIVQVFEEPHTTSSIRPPEQRHRTFSNGGYQVKPHM